ncbi:hypothetical protein IAI10_01845 [Clostridium sp. 19966]|uniref:hypothetical protein n=1 Tax=Clostridium sp. 19966 TaxID=2768166 RepID=UPI0028DF913F|nr:hypothetical protein [Clostridium sp. 19966]MDT8715398.1 hypothetical protein [Clostridium sp. 19966]
MLLFIEILGALCMLVVMFVAIWSFVILNQIFGQFRYKNYLLEKLVQNVYMLSKENVNIKPKNEKTDEVNICENDDEDENQNKKVIHME